LTKRSPLRADQWFERSLAKRAATPEFLEDRIRYQITEQIVEALEEQGLQRRDLADRMGVSAALVSRLLNGSPNLTISTLARVASALGLDVDVRLSAIGKARSRGSSAARELVST
jgi:transcriptional regulator with XRE-family HTH domain